MDLEHTHTREIGSPSPCFILSPSFPLDPPPKEPSKAPLGKPFHQMNFISNHIENYLQMKFGSALLNFNLNLCPPSLSLSHRVEYRCRKWLYALCGMGLMVYVLYFMFFGTFHKLSFFYGMYS